MAPPPEQWPYANVPSNEPDFLADLEAWHAQRGTVLDREPKISTKTINLFRLFQLCEAKGGYDHCSREKLMWRKLGTEFGLNAPAYAFQVKSVYYKNLAAYAIKKIHQKEPPPKEILEDLTARGGDLMTRTLDNFRPNTAQGPQDGEKEASGDEGQGTPKAEKMDIDDPSSAGRGGRHLRQAPPPRQFFQPDTTSSRTTRPPPSNASSPNPPSLANGTFTAAANPSSASFAIQAYEPSAPVPLTLRPVQTPKNNPKLFNDRVQRMRDAHKERLRRRDSIQRGLLLPGTGFDGPNIYTRITNAMRSGIEDEQAYALHHLIKISEVRGDRFRFDAFQGLAESLITKTLEVSSLFYDVNWEISYEIGVPTRIDVLDGLRATPDIVKRMSKLPVRPLPGTFQTEEFATVLNRSSEAALVLRNMVLLEANSQHLAQLAPCRDMLSIVLNLPAIPEVIEIKHYMLDIAEQLTRFWPITSKDPLFKSLMAWIEDGEDRGAILTSIRAICRIGYFMQDSIPLPTLPPKTLQQMQSWLYLDDDELVEAVLQFLYQYSVVPANVSAFLEDQSKEYNRPVLLEQLARFVLHNAKEDIKSRVVAMGVPPHSADSLARIPEPLLQQLVSCKETERSSMWLRSMFEEDSSTAVTQLELWQAYQNTFVSFCPPQGPNALLAAADFIRNVSSTFKSAEAKVDPPTEERPTPRFIIKGIKFRHTPVDLKGVKYTRCLWADAASTKKPAVAAVPGQSAASTRSRNAVCGGFFHAGAEMGNHILKDHLGVNRSSQPNGTEEDSPSSWTTSIRDCHWARCHHFAKLQAREQSSSTTSSSSSSPAPPTAQQIMRHFLTHMPETSPSAAFHRKHNKTVSPNDPNAVYREHRDSDVSGRDPKGMPIFHGTHAFEDTLVDDQGHPAGVAYWAVMCLRNLARNVPKAAAAAAEGSALAKGGNEKNGEAKKKGDGKDKSAKLTSVEWVERCFLEMEYHLWHVLAYNRVLRPYVYELLMFIEKGKKVPKE